MNQILLVARSEFLRRVRSRVFILTTLLAPFGIIAFFALTIGVSVYSIESEETSNRVIGVVDNTGVVLGALMDLGESQNEFVLIHDEEQGRRGLLDGSNDAYITVPEEVRIGDGTVTLYTMEGGALGFAGDIRRQIQSVVREKRILEANISLETLDIVNTYVDMETVRISRSSEEDDDESAVSAFLAGSLLGMLMAMLVFVAMMLYGQVVMYGVMEEKQTRVVEILISSIRPLNLLFGKVIGIGAMGLAQLTVWGLLIITITVFGGTIVGLFLEPADYGMEATTTSTDLMDAAGITIPTVPIPTVIWFILFFLGSYLLFASLFGAVGSMVEQIQDAQGLLTPLVLPMMLPMIFLSAIVTSPNSTLSVVLSFVPITSPVAMVVRMVVTPVPFWQILIAFVLLVGSAVFAIWISSRIYRFAILMRGKKATYKDAMQWIRHA